MHWCRATVCFHLASILLCSAGAVHRRHSARVLTPKAADNGTASFPDECSTSNQVARALWDVIPNACVYVHLTWQFCGVYMLCTIIHLWQRLWLTKHSTLKHIWIGFVCTRNTCDVPSNNDVNMLVGAIFSSPLSELCVSRWRHRGKC